MNHEPLVYKVKEACRIGGFRTTKAYELIGAGVLDARKSGASTLITAESLRAYVAGLPKATITTGRAANLCKLAPTPRSTYCALRPLGNRETPDTRR